jgi:DNA-binding winged helix-turn-helix (wHTH) protein/tetratricopeptide (TPR) repeat protein
MGLKVTDESGCSGRTFHFGQFEAHVASGKLLRQGREVKLQDQPFRLLVALLERPDRVVSRQELKDSLWPQGTLVEFDKSLDVAMAKLRHALRDSSGSPLFIETLPKRGYRFIAPVSGSTGAAEATPSGPVPPALPPSAAGTPTASGTPTLKSRVPRFAAFFILTAMLMLIAWYWQSHRPKGLSARAAVVVGEFSNATGDASFDRSLRTAVIIDLAQSPYLTIVSDERIGETLQSLGRPPDDRLQPAVLRQVCQHEHAAAAINGSIDRADAGYLVSITSSRCSDGSILATAGFRVAAKERVLTDLADALIGLRQRFGESKESLRQYDLVALQATTNSLEALKAYQLGMDLRSHTRNMDAIPAFKESLRLDPTFAIAYAQLGSCYSNLEESELATEFFKKAFDLREHATEPERLYITGRYFDIVTAEIEKGSGIYKLWTEIYPNDWRGHNSLANDANLLGRFDVAAAAAERVIELEPDHAYGYTNRAVALLGLNRLSEATQVSREAVRRGRDGGVVHSVLLAVALINGDAAGVAQERDWAAKHPDELDIPYIEAEMGLRDEALARARFAAQFGSNEQALELRALVYARAGDAAAVHRLVDQINSQFPLSTYNISVFAPTIRTALGMAGSLSAAEVDDWMQPTIPYEAGRQAGLAPMYIRGLAYLNAHAAEAAEREFRKLIDHRGADPASPLYPLAYLGLAESLVARGDVAGAGKAYEFVLDFWKDADPDLPVLMRAKREYQDLRRN